MRVTEKQLISALSRYIVSNYHMTKKQNNKKKKKKKKEKEKKNTIYQVVTRKSESD